MLIDVVMSLPVSPSAKFSKLLCLHLNNSITTRYHHNKTDTNVIFSFLTNVDIRIRGSSGSFNPVRSKTMKGSQYDIFTPGLSLFLLETQSVCLL